MKYDIRLLTSLIKYVMNYKYLWLLYSGYNSYTLFIYTVYIYIYIYIYVLVYTLYVYINKYIYYVYV